MPTIWDPLQSSKDMTRSEENGHELSYIDEVHDDVSRPLTDAGTLAVPSVTRSRNSSMSEPELPEVPNNLISIPGDFNELSSRFGGLEIDPSEDLVATATAIDPTQITPDVNVYQYKKTLAQGMMDIALLSANANQMRYVLQTDGKHPYFYPALAMISMSLFLQVAVGIGLIWNSRYNVKEHEQMCKANKANNLTVIGIFLVTILNVFISSFGVVDQASAAAAVAV